MEQTLNSFLHCCTDISRAGHFLLIDAGLSGEDREMLCGRYGFLDFTDPDPELVRAPGVGLARIAATDHRALLAAPGRAGRRFFAP